jgi:hypothetical protein
LEAFNVKVGKMTEKLDANMAINNSKVEQCSNQTNLVMCMIMLLQRKCNISIEKVATLEKMLQKGK